MNTLEVHILSCRRDLDMLINCIASFRSFDYFKDIPFYIHSDGTLRSDIILGGNITIIDKSEADIQIKEYIKGYSNCEQYRFGNFYHHFSIKLFDFMFLSKTKNILCLDTDILCINNPTHMIDLINRDIPFYMKDMEPCYSFNHPERYPVLESMNAGVFHIPSNDYYNIDIIENCLIDYISNDGKTPWLQWVEQSTYSHMFKLIGGFIPLPEHLYTIPSQDKPYYDSHILHFVSGLNIRDKYKNYLISLKNL